MGGIAFPSRALSRAGSWGRRGLPRPLSRCPAPPAGPSKPGEGLTFRLGAGPRSPARGDARRLPRPSTRSNFQPTSGSRPTSRNPQWVWNATDPGFGRAITAIARCRVSPAIRVEQGPVQPGAETAADPAGVEVDAHLHGRVVGGPRAKPTGLGPPHRRSGVRGHDPEAITPPGVLIEPGPPFGRAIQAGLEGRRGRRDVMVVDAREGVEVLHFRGSCTELLHREG